MSADLGIDRSGNGNNWTVTNLAYSDQMVDSPTNNFATWNPLLETPATTGTVTFSEGNLSAATPTTGPGITISSMGATSGKYYAEILYAAQPGLRRIGFGFTGDVQGTIDINTTIGTISSGLDLLYYSDTGNKLTALGTPGAGASYGATYDVGDIIGIALNIDDSEVTFYKNNTAQDSGTAISFTSGGTYHFAICDASAGAGGTGILNCGQDSSFAGNKTAQGNQDGNSIGDFYYTPPTGFLALCTSNLPAVAVTPSEHFNTVLYTGDGNSTQTLTTSFEPDFIWNKIRNQAYHHRIYDRVRGLGEQLNPNITNAENAYQDYGYPTATSATSITVGQGTDSGNLINYTDYTGVLWLLKANGSGSSNTNGSITSTVSANTDAGFSIVSYTGTGSNATVGHGLSVTPEMIIVKNREDGGMPWLVYHADNTSAPETDYLVLNTAAATTDYHTAWNDTAPTSSVFSVGTADGTNKNTQGHIAYCFHSVDGYSKVGGYTGNGSTDGTFVYLGFRPAYVMIKIASGADNWGIFDVERETYNTTGTILRANSSGVEESGSAWYVDLLSNGFKARSLDSNMGTSGATYIYLAFAETPFKYSNAR